MTVFEQAPRIQEVGTGIQVWLNGAAALAQLGVGDQVQARGAPVESQEFRSWRGPQLVYVPVGELARKYGSPPAVVIRRPDLIGVLQAALSTGVVQTESRVEAHEQDDSGVSVRLADGRVERGAALIGAEGLISPTREQLSPSVRPRYAGYQYLRAITENNGAMPEGCMTLTFGRGDRFGMGDVGAGRIYWFGVIVVPEGQTDSQAGRKRDLLDRFGRFPDPIPRVIEETAEEEIFRTDICDLDPMEKWREGRVTLLGDSAHAITPNMGRGASEAIEDAAVMGECLSGSEVLADGEALCRALRDYEQRRMVPTAKVQSGARRIGDMASWRNPVRCRIRDVVMKRVAGKSIVKDIESELASAAGARPAAHPG